MKISERGVTLMELMVATLIMGTLCIAGIGMFGSVQKSIQYSKSRTLATNLAQEKMQILKQQSYNKLMISTSTALRTDFNPSIQYDLNYYPPETILEGGIRFTRITLVQVAQENSGNIEILADTTPDTGMKLVTISVIWSQGSSNQKVQVRGIDSNPNTVMSNAILKGTMRDLVTNAPIQNGLVNIAENMGWRDTTSAIGAYSIGLTPGNFNVIATADGYFSTMMPFSINANATITQDFTLRPMSSGTIRGAVWINDHLVISQVVGSTGTLNPQEYVELFNPSTYTWTIASNATTPVIDLTYQVRGQSPTTIIMNYTTLTIGPGRYYLMASTTTVRAVGIARTADAVFTSANAGFPNIIKTSADGAANDASSLAIAYTATGARIDQVGWKMGSNDPPFQEGAAIVDASGLQPEEQYVRRSSTAGVVSNIGRSYDTGSNNIDFWASTPPLVVPPRNSSDTEPIVSGSPAYGAFVTATDGLSAPTTAYTANPSSYPFAEFLLPRVGTGTWTVLVTSSSRVLEISSVTMTANTTTWVTNSGTSPAWPTAGQASVILSSNASTGYVSGRITTALGAVISPPITVSARGGGSTVTGTNGMYLLNLLPGAYTITANPNNANALYVSRDSVTPITITLGEVMNGIDFPLSLGGRIAGFVTRDGINALSGVGMVAINAAGIASDQEISGTNGRYTLVNLSTGIYTVQPVLDVGETSNPTSQTVTVTGGSTIQASTFTILGDMGSVTGTVTKSGAIIKTGVLVVVATTTFSAPMALSSNTLSSTPYYSNSSLEDGTYRVEVRGSSTTVYRVHAFYSTIAANQTVSVTSGAVAGVSILAGQTTSGVNFSW